MARTKQAMRRPRTVKPLHQSLIECIEDNDVNGLRRCLSAGADPNKRVDRGIKYGTPPLVLAAEEGFADCIHYLVLYGADVDESWGGRYNEDWGDTKEYPETTALFHAATSGYADAVNVLIAAGAEVDFRRRLYTDENSMGPTALHWAASEGTVDTVVALLRAGASVSSDNEARRDDETLEFFRGRYARFDGPYTPLCEALDRTGSFWYRRHKDAEERERIIHALLRAGAEFTPEHAAVSATLRKVTGAGGAVAYGRGHNRALVTILGRGTRLPADVVPTIVSFWSIWGWCYLPPDQHAIGPRPSS